MGLRGPRSAEADPHQQGLYDMPALRLLHGSALPHAADLCSQGTSDSQWRAPDKEVPALDRETGGGDWLVPGDCLMSIRRLTRIPFGYS